MTIDVFFRASGVDKKVEELIYDIEDYLSKHLKDDFKRNVRSLSAEDDPQVNISEGERNAAERYAEESFAAVQKFSVSQLLSIGRASRLHPVDVRQIREFFQNTENGVEHLNGRQTKRAVEFCRSILTLRDAISSKRVIYQ